MRETSGLFPAHRPGRSREAGGNAGPRRMAATFFVPQGQRAIQNPAYRPAGNFTGPFRRSAPTVFRKRCLRAGRLSFSFTPLSAPRRRNNPSLGLMEDKDADASKSAPKGVFQESLHPVPVDAHIAPCYPIHLIKSWFLLRVKRARSVRPRGRVPGSCARMSGQKACSVFGVFRRSGRARLPRRTGHAAGAALWRRGHDDEMGFGECGCSG